MFVKFNIFIEKHLQKSIKTVQTDWGGEFRSFSSLLNNSGIHFRHHCPHIHHQNRRIERKHRHIVDIGLTLLAQAHLSLKLWWNAFQTAVYLINRLPTPVLNNISPYQKLFHQKPNYSTLRIFGCACFPYLRPYNRHKLEFRTGRCIFIGYSSHHKSYLCLHSSGRTYISNHVVFDEKSFSYVPGLDFSSVTISSQIDSVLQSDSEYPSVIHLQAPLAATSASDSAAPVSISPQVFSQHSPLLLVSTTNTSNHTSNSSPNSYSPLRNSPPHILPAPPSIGHSMITRSKNGIFKPKSYLSALLA